jgi:hypothetical protein
VLVLSLRLFLGPCRETGIVSISLYVGTRISQRLHCKEQVAILSSEVISRMESETTRLTQSVDPRSLKARGWLWLGIWEWSWYLWDGSVRFALSYRRALLRLLEGCKLPVFSFDQFITRNMCIISPNALQLPSFRHKITTITHNAHPQPRTQTWPAYLSPQSSHPANFQSRHRFSRALSTCRLPFCGTSSSIPWPFSAWQELPYDRV